MPVLTNNPDDEREPDPYLCPGCGERDTAIFAALAAPGWCPVRCGSCGYLWQMEIVGEPLSQPLEPEKGDE
jgi:hypothetical protein